MEKTPQSETAKESAKEGLSIILARLLDQLSPSAWLPAALLVSSLILLLRFQELGTVDVGRALASISDRPPSLIILIPLFVLATSVTQVLGYTATRVLRGELRTRGLAGQIMDMMIARHVLKLSRIREAERATRTAAFEEAAGRLLNQDGVDPVVLRALRAIIETGEPPQNLTAEQEAELALINWRELCDPCALAALDPLIDQEEFYPATHRILPTLLGNRIRATRDRLSVGDIDPEEFLLLRRDMVPDRLRAQLDQFRTLLDMYSVSVFVAAFLAALTPVLLLERGIPLLAVVGVMAVYLSLSGGSYAAAIASAHGYCQTLESMAWSHSELGSDVSAAPDTVPDKKKKSGRHPKKKHKTSRVRIVLGRISLH